MAGRRSWRLLPASYSSTSQGCLAGKGRGGRSLTAAEAGGRPTSAVPLGYARRLWCMRDQSSIPYEKTSHCSL